jgi:hypothetical protein
MTLPRSREAMSILRRLALNWRAGGPRRIANKASARVARSVRLEHSSIAHLNNDPHPDPPRPPPGIEIHELDEKSLVASGFFKAVAFPERVATRFAEGDRCVGIFFEGRIGHVAWMKFDAVPIDWGLPTVPVPGGVGIYDGFTLRDFRGRGAHTYSVLTRCSIAARLGADRVVSLITEENAASRHVNRKCGFEEAGRVRYSRLLWRERLEHPDL